MAFVDRTQLFYDLQDNYFAINFIKGYHKHFNPLPEKISAELYERLLTIARNFARVKMTSYSPKVPRTYKMNENGEIYIRVTETFTGFPISFKLSDPKFEGLNYDVENVDLTNETLESWKSNPIIAKTSKLIGNSFYREMFYKFTQKYGTDYFNDDDLEVMSRGHVGTTLEKRYFLFPALDIYAEDEL